MIKIFKDNITRLDEAIKLNEIENANLELEVKKLQERIIKNNELITKFKKEKSRSIEINNMYDSRFTLP